MKLTDLEADVRAEDEGRWLESPEFPGLWALVRSMHNPDFERAQTAMQQRFAKAYGRKPVPSKVQKEGFARLMVDHAILGLKGLEDDAGKQFAYTKEFGFALMTERKYRKIAEFFDWAVARVGDKDVEQRESDEGNSEPSPSGRQAGAKT
ncbi:MAG: hypothetical protein ACPGWS_09325, partial [Solirubrobacterales bacterium]